MLTTSSMELLSVVVLKERLEDVTTRLLNLGIFHPVDIRDIENELKGLSPLQIDREYADWDALETRTRELSRKMGVSPTAQKDIKEYTPVIIKDTLDGIESRLAPLAARKEELELDLKAKEAIFLQMKNYPLFSLKRDSVYSFLEISLGRIDERNMDVLHRSFKDMPHIIYPFRKDSGQVMSLFIGLRRDRIFMEKVFKDLGWEKIDYPKEPEALSKEVQEKIFLQMEQGRKDMEKAGEDMKSLGRDCRPALSSIQSFISMKRALLEAKKFSCATEKTILLSGWVPLEEKEKAVNEIRKIDSVSYLEAKDAEDVAIPREDIPVRLRHSQIFKPFELLINSYGIPRYGTIDPTIFVAVSFLLMFGAMFGDLGHGLVLCLSSLLFRKAGNEKVRQALSLIFYCGVSSAVFGVLYGSFFGFEFESVWIKPMEDILSIFKVSVFFGIGVISTGILINVVNALRDKDYIKAIFDKAGLIGGVLYWAAIGALSKLFIAKKDIPFSYLMFICAGLALLFLKPVIESFFRVREENKGMMVALIESTVDILEIGMGYLANTVSFIRIAAFALAHAGLFLAIFELSRIVNSSAGPFASFLVVILGNALIILLEGLVVTIQSLRLNYYEFFSKFFMTGKHEYKPLSI
ncbi:MAG: V-type ATPase 116kDa subunit family protein [Candidatus Omnitrophota bacterium]